MKFKKYFDEFCSSHGYDGTVGFDSNTNVYELTITKDFKKGRVFLFREELEQLNNEDLKKMINVLHKGFIERYGEAVISMKFKKYFDEFCSRHGYDGTVGFDSDTNEYEIIITKGFNNAGVFLFREELEQLNNEEMKKMINVLHKEFMEQYGK